MNKKSLILSLLVCLVAIQASHAQCTENVIGILDANKSKMVFQNNGNMFWDRFSGTRAEVPQGTGLSPVAAGSFWAGGLDSSNDLHLAVTGMQTSSDWFAGPYSNASRSCLPTIQTLSDIMIDGVKRLSSGKVLVVATNELLVYDLQTTQIDTIWLPAPRINLRAIELPDGRVMLVGDETYPTKNPVLFLDTLTMSIVGGPTLQWFHKESSMDLLDNGKVLIAGVVGSEVFDPATNLSAAVPDMLWPRMKHGTAKLANGDIMAFGGGSSINGSGVTLVTQYFNDTLGYWFPGPSLSIGRQRASATRMPDGRVLVCGGAPGGGPSEIYDPVTNTVANGPLSLNYSNEQYVSVIDSHTVVIGSSDPNLTNLLYTMNIQSGETHIILQNRSGAKTLLIDPTMALAQVDDPHQLQLIDFELGLQSHEPWQQVWKLNRTEIDQFKADFLANAVDFAHYPQIETWPAHGNEANGEDRNLAPFVDVNQDGQYRPAADGDYPCIVGDQALWWVFNDVGPHVQSLGRVIGMQVEAMAYVVDCQQTACPDSNMAYATFLHLELSKQINTSYHDMYVSNWMDSEIGEAYDDYVASDSSLHLALGYNADNQDFVFSSNPPAWGVSVLPNGQLGQMDGMMTWQNSFIPYYGSPSTAEDYYNYMHNTFLDGQHMVNNGNNGYPGNGPGPNTNYVYSSTNGFCAGTPTGWNEISAGSSLGDRTFLQNVGPFTLQIGEEKQVDLAFVYARDSSNLASVCALKSSTATIRDWWQNQLDRSCFSLVVAREEPITERAFEVYPNPTGDGHVTLDLGKALLADGQLEVMDLQGRRLKVRALPAGAQRYQVQLQDLPAGMYLLRVQDESHSATQRLIVQH